MSKSSARDKMLSSAVSAIKNCGFEGRSNLIDLLYRVVVTKRALSGDEENSETLYSAMREASSSLPRFPGDAELFFTIYKALSGFGERDILRLIYMTNDGKELCAPDAIFDNFSGYISADTNSVLVTECEQYGVSIFDLIEKNPSVKFTLTTSQTMIFELFCMVYESLKNVEVLLTDIYRYGFTNEKFDLIFCIPAFGGRTLVNGEDFICREPDLIAVQNLLYHINMNGDLVIVLPARITFGGGDISALREYIESNYKIKEISILPSGLFAPYTSIRTYQFVLSNGKTDDVVVKQYCSDEAIRKTSFCQKLVLRDEVLLFSDEFADLDGWKVDMVFSKEDEDLKAFSASPIKKIRLKDDVTVFRGKAVKEKDPSGNIAVVNISNITDTGIDYQSLELIKEEIRKVLRYALEDGDVLVTSKGTTLKIAVFEQQSTICIPSANITVIRTNGMLRGTYLKLFLESPVGIKMLQSLQRGSTAVNINYKDIAELEVPVLPLDVQDDLIKEYNTGLKLYKDTIAAAEEGWRGVLQDIQSKLY